MFGVVGCTSTVVGGVVSLGGVGVFGVVGFNGHGGVHGLLGHIGLGVPTHHPNHPVTTLIGIGNPVKICVSLLFHVLVSSLLDVIYAVFVTVVPEKLPLFTLTSNLKLSISSLFHVAIILLNTGEVFPVMILKSALTQILVLLQLILLISTSPLVLAIGHTYRFPISHVLQFTP